MTGGALEKGSRHDLYDLNTTNQTPSRCVSHPCIAMRPTSSASARDSTYSFAISLIRSMPPRLSITDLFV